MYVIIGASGYLGTYLIKNILEHTDERVLAAARHPLPENASSDRVEWATLDISDPCGTEAFCERYLNNGIKQPQLGAGSFLKMIYLAAYHHPDMVEKNPRIAWDVNITSLSRFLNLSAGIDRFFYSSTESVYGESREGYRFKEDDACRPANRYGVLKSCAERLVTAYGYNVVRFPVLFGHSLVPGKKHFYDTIVETVTDGRTIDMFSDSYRSALDFNTAARLLIETMEKPSEEVPQILNICGDEALSKYEIGQRVADLAGAPRELVRPVSIHDDTGIFTVKRAPSTLMDNTLMKRLLGLDKVQIDLRPGNKAPVTELS